MSTVHPPFADLTIGQRGRRVLWQPFSQPTDQIDTDGLHVLVRGDGMRLFDTAGRSYIDGMGALEAMAIGHGRTRLADVAADQMKKLAFLDVFRYASEPGIELAEKLLAIAPDGFSKVAFAPGGSDANEIALKLIWQYHYLNGQTDRRKIICRQGAYHGTTLGTMLMDGDYYATRNDIYAPRLGLGVVATGPAADPGWSLAARHSAGFSEFEAAIIAEGPETVAAVVVDAIGTASAVSCPPLDELKRLRALCDKHGILLLVDEVITGFGRSGHMFASDYYREAGDLMTMSKALTSGYLPLAACLVSEKIVEAFASHASDNILAHGHTYGGHPVGCAVALENIRIIEEEELPARAASMGEILRGRLQDLQRHDLFVDARGVGLLTGVEFFPEGSSGGAHGTPAQACAWLRRKLRDLGLITLTVHPGTVFLLAPPLIIDEPTIEEIVAIFDAGLTQLNELD
ncbi:MAG: aminotransferase class III-fold pyridoxal phosphate-dependent enzyme, partial [bacterium]|nr:aminotransferase class III-fold pyridoxal phosphate-dependent enzyme [bacterium]